MTFRVDNIHKNVKLVSGGHTTITARTVHIKAGVHLRTNQPLGVVAGSGSAGVSSSNAGITIQKPVMCMQWCFVVTSVRGMLMLALTECAALDLKSVHVSVLYCNLSTARSLHKPSSTIVGRKRSQKVIAHRQFC
jgi:hypothetical protein